ncbi:MAG: exosortase/archaeosortase family protein [Nibricoccus sp.]
MPEPTISTPKFAMRGQDYAFTAGVFLLTAVVFWPALRWLASETFAHEQLKQSLFIMLIAGVWIAWEKRNSLRLAPQLTNQTLGWLSASYALAAAGAFLKNPLFFLAGLVTAAGGIVNFAFGDRAFRRTVPLLTVFGLLILFVLLFPVLDWPLRQMAGLEAARFLKALGFASQLGVDPGPPVRLILLSNSSSFHVATECNGFGLITSSLLLGTILLLFRRTPLWQHLLTLPLCIAIAFVFNFLRISAIVVLAPHFPGHYHAMHETLGLIAQYSGLAAVWWLTGRKRSASKAQS